MSKKKILILDGYNLFYRARYSGMNKGEYSTIFNFFRGLRPLVEKFNPDVIDLVLEGRPVKRLDVLAEYKGQRTYHDKDNFNFQRNEIVKIIDQFFPINLIRHPNFECDDVIGHLSKKYEANDNDVTIVSSDTDFIQLISDKINVYNPVKKSFLEKTEYDYVAWKSLVGDKSDNIEGFKGIGDKTAKKLLNDTFKLNEFLDKDNNRERFEKNNFLIKLHDLSEEENNIIYNQKMESGSWEELKDIFNNMSFNSIIGKESTWKKYINTFDRLF